MQDLTSAVISKQEKKNGNGDRAFSYLKAQLFLANNDQVKLWKTLFGEQICWCFLCLSWNVSAPSVKKKMPFFISHLGHIALLHVQPQNPADVPCDRTMEELLEPCSEIKGFSRTAASQPANSQLGEGLTLHLLWILHCSVVSCCVRDAVTISQSCLCFML